MTRDGRDGGAPSALRLWHALLDGLGALGSASIALLMALICADVLSRNLFTVAIPVVAEICALTVVMIVFLQLATTVRHGRTARSELFIAALAERRPRAAAWLETVFDLAGAVAVGLIGWATLAVLRKDLAVGEYIGVFGVLTLPTWPFRALILLGAAAAATHYLVRATLRMRGR